MMGANIVVISGATLPAVQSVNGQVGAVQLELSGDVTSPTGSLVSTLATVNSNVGTFGTSTQIPSLTVNAKGLVTAASNNALSLVAPPPIGSTTPNSGAFTTLSATGAIAPSQTSGIVGTTTNNNANAGSVGEYSSVTSTVTTITSATPTNIATLSLSAGDWDVQGHVFYTPQTGATLTAAVGGISLTSATLPAIPGYAQCGGISVPAGNAFSIVAPVARISLSSTANVFLVGQTVSGGGTVNSQGFIRARRVR